ncbi:LacI family DNA-binding transcriptional regulator [Deinococcus yavapaiensis]|uniref:LacI family transcriptional regulator n=1 Tax=Deinococcus yavapaiensis KR-236 TaxID=694435 RepID=A0A318SFZ9_9DEIO|nr:LacI family DNA-binding transcriptional regulator [Deinococcus yavapaiensis]PYE48336.1 LacI family transcriptional regulator [Deinococcus yavapaiensis KR-236]
MPTILDVAKRAGVSATTAKRALSDPHLLHPQTLRRVQEAIKELHYEPDQRAGSLRGGQSRTIGLVVGRFAEPFFAELAHAISQVLRQADYSVIISENEYDSRIELAELQRLYGQRVSALIVRPGYGEASRDYLLRLRQRGVYILEVDYHLEGAPFDSVLLDNAACVREGVEYLQGLGHTRIAALSKYDAVKHPETRSKLFPQAMAALGLSIPDEYARVIDLREDTAYELTRDLMALATPPTALFAFTGSQAAGAFRALKELGLRVGRDISLLTFDNYSWTALVDPGIDVIEQPVRQMGDAAARIVMQALEQGPSDRPIHLALPGRLIRRGSCVPPESSPPRSTCMSN